MQTDNTMVRLSITLVLANLLSGCAVKIGTLDLSGAGSVFSQKETDCSVNAVAAEAPYYRPGQAGRPYAVTAFTTRLARAISCELQREHGGEWDINPDGLQQAQALIPKVDVMRK